MSTERLPSWRPGRARDTILTYLDSLDAVPERDRVAYLDNDGTMWCERPTYVQYDFFVDELRRRSQGDPSLLEKPELAAVLHSDTAAMGELGLARIAGALASLFDDRTPSEFAAAVDAFMARYRHPTFGLATASLAYRPMLELLEELRAHRFTIGIVTGGGTEFVRRVSEPLYGVPAELVVGTLIGYRFERDADERPMLRRTVATVGEANEGPSKVANIQSQIGRAPIVAVGNSGGDREMLEWAMAGPHPGLAVLVDHDDAEREFAYESAAVTFHDAEPITAVADRLGWLTVSIRDDWSQVFAGG